MANLSGVGGVTSLSSFLEMYTQTDRKPIDKLSERKKSLQNENNIYTDLKTELNTLRDRLKGFASYGSESSLSSKAVTSSNSSFVTAEASESAVAGVHSISIKSIASRDTAISDAINFESNSLAKKFEGETHSISISVNGVDKSFEISFDDKDETNESVLSRVADKINDSDLELTASSIRVKKNTYKLVLVSKETGSDAAIELTDAPGSSLFKELGMVESNGSRAEASKNDGGFIQADSSLLDAEFNIDGVDIVQSSNVVDEVIEGLTITLYKAQEEDAQAETLSVTADSENLKKEINGFIEDFNSTIKYINAKSSTSGSLEERGIFASNFSVRKLKSSLREVSYKTIGSIENEEMNTLSEIGIAIERDGTLKIDDQDKFDEALNNNSQDVKDMFVAEDGVAESMLTELSKFTQTGGVISDKQRSITSQIRNIDLSTKRLTERIERKSTSLSRQYTDLQRLVSTLNSQRSFIERFQSTFQSVGLSSGQFGL